MHPNDCRLNGGDIYSQVGTCVSSNNCAYVDCCFAEQGQCVGSETSQHTEVSCLDAGGTLEDCNICDNTTVTCCEDPDTETCNDDVTQTYCDNVPGETFAGNCTECRYVGCCAGGGELVWGEAGCRKTEAYDCDSIGDSAPESIIYDPGPSNWDDDDFNAECANKCEGVICCVEPTQKVEGDINACCNMAGNCSYYYSEFTCQSDPAYKRNVVDDCATCTNRRCCIGNNTCDATCDDGYTETTCIADNGGVWDQNNLGEDFCETCIDLDCRDCCIPNVACHPGVDQTTCDDLAGASSHSWDFDECNTCNTDPFGCCCMEESDLPERQIGTCHVLIQSDCTNLDNGGTVRTTWSDTNYSGGVCTCPDCARRKCCYLVGDTNEEVAHCVDMTPSECDAEDGELSDYGSGQHPNDAFCAACTAPDLIGTCCYFWPPDGHGFRDCGVLDGSHCNPEQNCTNSIECSSGDGGCFCDVGKCRSVLDAVCPCGGSDCFGCLETCCAPDLMPREECIDWWNCGEVCDPTGNTMPGTQPGVRWNAATSPDCSDCSFNNEFGSCCVGNLCETKSSGNITEYECEVLHGGDWILDGTCADCSSCPGGSDQECKVDDDCIGDYAGMGCCCGCCALTCDYDMCGEFGYVDGGGSGTFWVADRWDTDGNQPGNGLGSLIVFNQGTSNIPQVNEFRRHHGRIEWRFLVDLPDFPLDPWNNSNFVGQDSITTDSAWGNYFGTNYNIPDFPDDDEPLYDPASSFGSKITFRVTNNITDTTYTYTSYSSRGFESGDTVWWIQTGGSPPRWVCECEGNNCDGYNSNNPAIDSDTLWGEEGGINPSFTVKYEPVVDYAQCCVNFGDFDAACVLLSWQQCEDQTGDADTYWDYQCANCVDTKKCCIDNHSAHTVCYNGGQEVSEAFCDAISGGAWMGSCDQCVAWTQCCKNHETVDAECEPSWPENLCLANDGRWDEFACNDCTPTPTAQCCKEDFTCSTTVLETQADCEGAGGTWGENACTGCKAPAATGYCCRFYGTDIFECDGSDDYDTQAECEEATGGSTACGGVSCWTAGDGGLCTNCVGSPKKQCCIGGTNFPWTECHEDVTAIECNTRMNELITYWGNRGVRYFGMDHLDCG